MHQNMLRKMKQLNRNNASNTGLLLYDEIRIFGVKHMAYWWGHDTLEDKAARRQSVIDSKVIKWTDPESDVQAKKNTFYSPMRIQHEQEAMSSGYSPSRFNLSDWFTFARYPYVHARFTDPPFWHTQQKIKKYEKLVRGQPFIKERLVILGPDLSAAHFLCHRQCRVKFKGRDDYTELQLNSFTMPGYVPQEYEKGWYVEEIDASNSFLIYEGLQNMRNLMYLKKLNISYSIMLDAWCIDRITGEYQDSLEYLDISGCTGLDWNALECLWRLRKLKVLVLQDMDHIKDIDLLCLMLLEALPDLQIKGVDYMADAKTLLEESVSKYLLDDLDKSMLLLTDGDTSSENHSSSVNSPSNAVKTESNQNNVKLQNSKTSQRDSLCEQDKLTANSLSS